MPDHRIRLRGAWERLETSSDPPPPPCRVDLPVIWSPRDATRPFRLIRRFGHPTIDPARQRLVLELADVPGLRAVRLNGQPLDLTLKASVEPVRIELPAPLPARNLLEVEVVLLGSGPAAFDQPWGSIALVIEGE